MATTSPITSESIRSYGTLDEFKAFLAAAHAAACRVITELVHQPHLRPASLVPGGAACAGGIAKRDFYVWSDTPDRYRRRAHHLQGLRARRTGRGTRSPKAYYWHRFYPHQPDLNFDNPAVREAVLQVCDFWLDIGVDGLRLDAVPYLYEREGTNCENLPETHAFLKAIRAAHRRSITRTACCSRKRINGRKTRSRISATATNATWRFIFR